MGSDQGFGWVMGMMEVKVRYRGCVITVARYGIYVILNQGDDRMEGGGFTLRLLPWKLGYPEPVDPSIRRRLTCPTRGGHSPACRFPRARARARDPRRR